MPPAPEHDPLRRSRRALDGDHATFSRLERDALLIRIEEEIAEIDRRGETDDPRP